jgi:hypothetical protein
MREARFGVFRDNITNKQFVVWHETQEEAIAEAERLAGKERCDFVVIKEIGIAKPILSVPTIFETCGK